MFLLDLQKAWEEKGKAVIEATMATKPDAVLKVMAALLPKQVENTSPLDELTDEELAIIAEALLAKYGDPRAREEAPRPRLEDSGRTGDAAPVELPQSERRCRLQAGEGRGSSGGPA
jgi:hypothetical protein